jgi:hypothetical protein
MKQQAFTTAIPPHWWERLKGAQFGFIAGILIGLIFGWIFHGVISVVIRFGMLVLLLLPLIVIGWLWFRSQRSRTSGEPENRPGPDATWTAVIDVERAPAPSRVSPTESPLIDVPLVKPAPESKPDDIEAMLADLKRQQERGS